MKELLTGLSQPFTEAVKRYPLAAYSLIAILAGTLAYNTWGARDDVNYSRLISTMDLQSIEIKNLKEENKTLRFELRQLERELANLQVASQTASTAILNNPFPSWVKNWGTKDNPGVMLALNDAAMAQYFLPAGKSRASALFSTDSDVWGADLGAVYWQSDLDVIRCKCVVYDTVPDPVLPEQKVLVRKWPIVQNGNVIAVAGDIIPDVSRYAKIWR